MGFLLKKSAKTIKKTDFFPPTIPELEGEIRL
jgi:hypothetical protein